MWDALMFVWAFVTQAATTYLLLIAGAFFTVATMLVAKFLFMKFNPK